MNTLKAIGITLLVLVTWGLVGTAINNSSTATGPDPNNNSRRNAFISGCEIEGDKTLKGIYTDAQITDYCKCAITKLEQKHPDILTNDEKMNNILKNGYSKEDTDVLAQCIPAV
jgi:hypothetical protein